MENILSVERQLLFTLLLKAGQSTTLVALKSSSSLPATWFLSLPSPSLATLARPMPLTASTSGSSQWHCLTHFPVRQLPTSRPVVLPSTRSSARVLSHRDVFWKLEATGAVMKSLTTRTTPAVGQRARLVGHRSTHATTPRLLQLLVTWTASSGKQSAKILTADAKPTTTASHP